MANLVVFHAHPDDESIQTGGTMAKAAADGHRVTLVVATRGDHGEIVPDVLDDGEQLGLRRIDETYRSAEILGVQRVEFLGYVDSGMMGEPTNDNPASFWRADIEHAARRLALILEEEKADALTHYDEIGGYGHPDHIQVHRVGRRAAELAGTPRRFMATMNRDFIVSLIRERIEAGDIGAFGDEGPPDIDEENFGQPGSVITHQIDVSAFAQAKRDSMKAHASQIADDHFFLALPDEAFAVSFGQEWFIDEDASSGGEPFATDLFT